MIKCPRCGTELKENDINKVKGNVKIVKVGKELFCPRMDCNYEMNL